MGNVPNASLRDIQAKKRRPASEYALDIWHPFLEMLDIKSVIVRAYSQPEPIEDGTVYRIKTDPTFATAHFCLGMHLRKENKKTAAEHLKKAAELGKVDNMTKAANEALAELKKK